MSTTNESSSTETAAPSAPKRKAAPMRMAMLGGAAVAILAVGAAAGAAGMKLTRPSVELAPLTPVAITSLNGSSSIVTVKGKVAEIYGNKFIVQDESGRALVESGRAGEGGKLVNVGEELNVQGRFDKGFLHASYIVHQDGRTEMLKPAGPPHPHGGPKEDALMRGRP